MTMPATTHVIYHGNCYDGFGAAWAAWVALGDGAKYIPAAHADAPPDLPADARVAIVDFSYPRPVIEAMAGRVASLVILDHHKTAEEALRGFPGATFDMDRSGATLSWAYFHPTEISPALIKYVEDRDLWRFALPASREASAYLQSFPYDFKTWASVAITLEDEFDAVVVREGGAILRAKQQMVDQMAARPRWRHIGGHIVPFVNATAYFSEVGDALCRAHPDAPFAAYYADRSDGKRQWGLRSRFGFDCSAVAKMYGGGGHPGAAGFVEPITGVDDWTSLDRPVPR